MDNYESLTYASDKTKKQIDKAMRSNNQRLKLQAATRLANDFTKQNRTKMEDIQNKASEVFQKKLLRVIMDT